MGESPHSERFRVLSHLQNIVRHCAHLSMFQFVNSFNSMFYIAFVKRWLEGCVEKGNPRSKEAYCQGELRTQLTIIFIVAIVKNLSEVRPTLWSLDWGTYSQEMSERTTSQKSARFVRWHDTRWADSISSREWVHSGEIRVTWGGWNLLWLYWDDGSVRICDSLCDWLPDGSCASNAQQHHRSVGWQVQADEANEASCSSQCKWHWSVGYDHWCGHDYLNIHEHGSVLFHDRYVPKSRWPEYSVLCVHCSGYLLHVSALHCQLRDPRYQWEYDTCQTPPCLSRWEKFEGIYQDQASLHSPWKKQLHCPLHSKRECCLRIREYLCLWKSRETFFDRRRL